MYNGGSDKDERFSIDTNHVYISYGNQIFISFTLAGDEVGIGFAAKITFGIRTCQKL